VLGLALGLGLGLGILINLRSDFYSRTDTKKLLTWQYLPPQ